MSLIPEASRADAALILLLSEAAGNATSLPGLVLGAVGMPSNYQPIPHASPRG